MMLNLSITKKIVKMIDFHLKGTNSWISADLKWAVYRRFMDNILMLYKTDTTIVTDYYYTGHKFITWDEIRRYIKNHSE